MKKELNLSLENKSLKSKNFKIHVQKIGSFMAGMIMPSIGVLLAWGLWTAMFLYDFDNGKKLGWFNAPMLGALIEPGIKWLLPILIAFNAGRLVYGIRGGMISTFVIVGTIVGTDWIYANHITLGDGTHPGSPNQFIGAMVIGPLSAIFLKTVEKTYLDKISKSYDMLVKNFGIGLFGISLALFTFFGWGWIMWGITWVMTYIISLFGDNRWIAPLMGIFTEPVKVSFLNNALNHGVLGPIGYNEIAKQTEEGIANPRSIFFLFDPNPGPGLGMLLAFVVFTKGENRYNAAGSSLIHTLGGIHEVYFVFILSKPKMVISTIAGVVTAQFITSYFGGGTIATPSPGSIISLIALSPGFQAVLINLLAFFVAAAVSFLIAGTILFFESKNGVSNNDGEMNFQITDYGISFNNATTPKIVELITTEIKSIVVACEAGMGSSAMAAGLIKKELKKVNINNINVTNLAVKDLTNEYDVVVTMNSFVEFAESKAPKAFVYGVDKFIGNDIYNPLIEKIKETRGDKNE